MNNARADGIDSRRAPAGHKSESGRHGPHRGLAAVGTPVCAARPCCSGAKSLNWRAAMPKRRPLPEQRRRCRHHLHMSTGHPAPGPTARHVWPAFAELKAGCARCHPVPASTHARFWPVHRRADLRALPAEPTNSMRGSFAADPWPGVHQA